MNKQKLKKLADYLEKLNPESFDMEFFRANNKGERVFYINKNNCGTAGCAVGWATQVKGLESIDSDFFYDGDKKLNLHFIKYSERVFGLDAKGWIWCFHEDWLETDNTPLGAAKRIMELVNNEVPNNWLGQMRGEAPYMFAED